jgi:pimeloyl-ACP methyl ester carboxylesterase
MMIGRTNSIGAGILALVAGCTAGIGTAPAGLVGPSAKPTPAYVAAPCPSPNVPGIPQLELGGGFSCGYLTVPEDRSKPDGPAIRVAVARLEALSPTPEPDPIVWLAGGPGGSAIATANITLAKGVNADRDVIFVDQRGTLHSEPSLSCLEIDLFGQEALGLPTLDTATREKSRAATQACRDRLAAGAELAAYDTIQNAADIADLRIALGIDQWNVRGVSYGSDLALQLLRNHPEGIRSVVLDSLVPPQLNLVDSLWPNAAEGYEALFAACAAQPACATAYPRLRQEFFETVRRLHDEPQTVEVTSPSGEPSARVVLDGYRTANLINVLALNPGKLAEAPAIVHALAEGNADPAAKMLHSVAPPGLNGYGLMFGVVCREETAFTEPAIVQAKAQRALPEFPEDVLAAVPQARWVFDDCAVWDVGRADPTVVQPTSSDVPVLLLNGSLDGVTPPSWAEVAADGLNNSALLVIPGAGHDTIVWNDCALQAMLDFLDRPGREVNSGCLAEMTVPPFAVTP